MAKSKSHIKLLFFTPYFWPYISGLTQYPYRFLTEHSFNNLTTTCLTFRHSSDLQKNEAISPRCNVIRMPFIFRLSKGFISPQSWHIFWSQLNKHDEVLLNLPSVEGVILALFARILRKPIISILHCEVLLPPGVVNRIINWILNLMVFIQLVLSKKIIVYTEDYYKDKPMYTLFRNKMEIILPTVHNVDPDISYRKTLRTLRKGKLCIGFCGRISHEKGIHNLIDAVKSISNSMILFAGPHGKDVVGEEVYNEKMKKKLQQANIPFHFLGTLSGSKLSAFYQSIDVLVLPSINKTEAFGMVQVEAMLQGTPVIASDLPGVRVPIQMSRMGILISPNNIDELSRAIVTISKQYRTYTSLKKTDNIKSMFNTKTIFEQIFSLIKQVSI